MLGNFFLNGVTKKLKVFTSIEGKLTINQLLI